MLLVKKRLWDQNILLLPIVLSLLRLFPDLYLGLPRSAIVDDVRSSSALTNGPSRYGGGRFGDEPVNLNPKSIEYLYQLHQSDILNDLTSLGRFSERNRRDIEAYVLSLVGDNPFRIENFSVPSTSESRDSERSDRRLVSQTLTRSLSSASDLSSADLSELNIFDLHINDDDLYPLEYQLGDKSLLEEAIGLSMSMEEPFVPSDLSSGETLSQEDVDIIEILWKQDVDLGLDRSIFQPVAPQSVGGNVKYTEYEKKDSEENKKDDGKEPENADTEVDPWAGLNYIIDSETGEHLLVEDLEVPSTEETSVTLPDTVLDRLGHIEQDLIDENLGIDLLDFAQSPEPPTPTRRHREQRGSEGEASSSGVSEGSLSEGEQETADALTDALAAELDSMLEGGMHHRSYPVRVPLVRGVNTDQRWQELAHLFTLPTADPHTSGHYHYPGYQGIAVPHAVYPNFANLHHDQRSALLHNASLAAPSLSVADLQANGSYPIGTHETGNTSHLGSAVAVSLNLTSNGTNSHVAGNNSVNAAAPAFKMEVTPDPGYYQPTADMPGTHQEGFFSSLLNDDDLHLMDVGMTDGAYGVRMVDANSNVQGGAGADSRSHPALSGADTARSEVDWPESHYMGYSSALRTVSNGAIGSGNGGGSDNRNPPQKKHQFYGKRFASDNSGGENSYFGGGGIESSADPLSLHSNDVKYPYPDYPGHSLDMRSSALDALHHNHSYSMNRSQEELSYRPISRDKRAATSSAMSSRSSTDGEMDQACRDEKRARSMGIPITIEDIINLPMDEFNERLAKYDLSETQLSLIRDIRRRGKNKVAAQNCRKRKLDQIMSLADEVRRVKDRKIRLAREREMLLMEKTRIKERFAMLHRHVFQSLRDPEGNPYSPYDYSLQQSADGSVVLVPRMAMRPGDHELGEPGPSSVIRKSGESARNATA